MWAASFRGLRSWLGRRRPPDLVDYTVLIGYRRQIHKGAQVDVIELPVGHRLQCETGLPATAGTDERDQTMCLSQLADRSDGSFASDEARHGRRKARHRRRASAQARKSAEFRMRKLVEVDLANVLEQKGPEVEHAYAIRQAARFRGFTHYDLAAVSS